MNKITFRKADKLVKVKAAEKGVDVEYRRREGWVILGQPGFLRIFAWLDHGQLVYNFFWGIK
jgi:hypothetical protein